MKKILIVIGSVLLAGAIAAGGFYAGMTYQTNRANQIRASFMNARGIAEQGQNFDPNSGARQFRSQGMSFPGGGTTGLVKTVEGETMTLSTAQNVATVNLSDTTTIEKTISGAISDIQPGMQVMVIGETDSAGNITASRITILSNNPNNEPPGGQPPSPPASNTEP